VILGKSSKIINADPFDLQKGIKDTKLMNYALIKGLKSLTKEDYMEMAKK